MNCAICIKVMLPQHGFFYGVHMECAKAAVDKAAKKQRKAFEIQLRIDSLAS